MLQQPVITSLTRVYKQSASAATSAVAKRKLEDVRLAVPSSEFAVILRNLLAGLDRTGLQLEVNVDGMYG